MPLLRAMARTTVVAGTATAVSNNVSRRQSQKWAEQEQTQPAYLAPQQTYPPEGPSGSTDDSIEQLKELAELKQQGILTEAEFTAQKTKILAG